jgi:hypothetical protein
MVARLNVLYPEFSRAFPESWKQIGLLMVSKSGAFQEPMLRLQLGYTESTVLAMCYGPEDHMRQMI